MVQTVGFSRALATVRRTVAARRDAKRRARAVRIPPCSPCIVCRKNKKQRPAGCCSWRRRWDSNPRGIAAKLISSQSRYDRFDTSPYISLYSIAKKRFSVNTFLPLRHGCKPYAAGPFCVFGAESAVSLQKRLFFWAGAEYNRNDIFQI